MSRYVLTIQSHVAYGFVGNSAAVFPLQLLGFSPIVVNTVEFSNHTGHPTFRGQVFTAELIRDIILGMKGCFQDIWVMPASAKSSWTWPPKSKPPTPMLFGCATR